jgi:transmembrane sensor
MVTLGNGSQILLGSATTLLVTTQPSNAGIDVHVVGQALFRVTHSDNIPLRVHAGNAVARVLGTTFAVRRYHTDRVTRVVVTAGRVSLSSVHGSVGDSVLIGKPAVLTANTLGTVDDSGTVQVTSHIAVEDYTGWTTGRLVFHNTPARDAVIELGRAYNVDIRIADSSLAAQKLNWTILLAQQSLGDVLESLVDVLDAHPVRIGRTINLIPGRAATRRPVRPSSLSSPPERQYGL